MYLTYRSFPEALEKLLSQESSVPVTTQRVPDTADWVKQRLNQPSPCSRLASNSAADNHRHLLGLRSAQQESELAGQGHVPSWGPAQGLVDPRRCRTASQSGNQCSIRARGPGPRLREPVGSSLCHCSRGLSIRSHVQLTLGTDVGTGRRLSRPTSSPVPPQSLIPAGWALR